MPDNPRDSKTALRFKLLENGYTPLPNLDKRCVLRDWPTIDVTPATVQSWDRMARYNATGLRVEGGLCVIDIDIDDQDLVDKVMALALERAPQLGGALCRFGRGAKVALFCRVDVGFSRIATRRWFASAADPDDGVHCVEAFGGGSARQFGAFGAHTIGYRDEIVIAYQWDDLGSPETVPLADLPAMTKADVVGLVDAIEALLAAEGYQPVPRTHAGENTSSAVYDITDHMFFDCVDGAARTTADLIKFAQEHDGTRCSASFIEGDIAKNRTRCLVHADESGRLSVWDSMHDVSHRLIEKKPVDTLRDATKVQEAFRGLRTRLEPPQRGDEPDVTVAKLLQQYAFVPNELRCVAPIERAATERCLTQTAFRQLMLPWSWTVVGPKGGEKRVNPADVWMASDDRVVVAGLRMRPDMPRPLYHDDGHQWLNTYDPVPHEVLDGDPSGGLELIEHLLPRVDEREWFMDWLSFKFQNPGIPGPAVVMVAQRFGTGRGTLFELVRRLFGEKYVRSLAFHMFAGSSYQAQYNEWSENALVVTVNESSDSEGGSLFKQRRDTYEHIKEIVEPRAVPRQIIRKGSQNYTTKTFTSYIIATNHIDALPIPEDDRRLAVLENGEHAYSPDLWKRINMWMDTPANVAAFARILATRDVGHYDPYAPPPRTSARSRMVAAAKTDLDGLLLDAVTSFSGRPFTLYQLMNATLAAEGESDASLPTGWREIVRRLARTRYPTVRGGDQRIKIGAKNVTVLADCTATAEAWKARSIADITAAVLENGPVNELTALDNLVQFKKKAAS